MFVLLPILLFAAQADASAGNAPPQGRAQIFIAPSGEPFRVHGDVPYPVARWFAGADKNSDGKLDLAEFEADFLRFFDQLDVNQDGAIDSGERLRYESEIAPETLGESAPENSWARQGGDDIDIAGQGAASEDTGPETAPAKPRYGANPVGAARFDLLGMPEPVAAMDAELRGRISRRDADEAARLRFSQLDTLHQGYLTLDQLPRTYAQRGGHLGPVEGGGGGRRRRR